MALLLVAAAAVALLVTTTATGGGLIVVVALCLLTTTAAAYWFLAYRGWRRAASAALLGLAPLVLVSLVVRAGLLVVLIVVGVVLALALAAGRAALAPRVDPGGMPEYVAARPRRPFVLMNPRSGGGRVGRFGLKEKAEELGAEVVLLEGPEVVDVAQQAREAVSRGVDLLGVAGGDGTQALVAGVAADHGLPFMVIAAGTRNHFALDLGLDRDDPTTGLAALTDEAVELHIDIGDIDGRPFVNNASFGAYAQVVQSPAYRNDKTRTTLDLLPDLLGAHSEPRLTATAEDLVVRDPQAVLVSVNPYGMGDIAGSGRRARLDSGRLGIVALTVDSARHAIALLRGTGDRGLAVSTAAEVVVTADASRIPVGVDGEALVLPAPVRCAIRPRALRVRVPAIRPGVPPPRPAWNWVSLWRMATVRRNGAAR